MDLKDAFDIVGSNAAHIRKILLTSPVRRDAIRAARAAAKYFRYRPLSYDEAVTVIETAGRYHMTYGRPRKRAELERADGSRSYPT